MDLSTRDIETAVQAAARPLSLVQIGLSVGPLLYLGVVVGLAVAGPAPQGSPDFPLLDLLSLVHALLAFTLLPVSLFLMPKVLTAKSRLLPCIELSRRDPAAGARALLNVIASARIVQLALLEGAALLGTTVCLLAVLQGAVAEHPLYWANAATTGVLLVVAVATFPTAPRLAHQARELAQR